LQVSLFHLHERALHAVLAASRQSDFAIAPGILLQLAAASPTFQPAKTTLTHLVRNRAPPSQSF
jgi:hypothetical protein